MEIGLGQGWPGAALSNLTSHEFIFRGVRCGSIEGVLQAVKKQDPNTQLEICKRHGMFAKQSGGTSWRKRQTLYWQGTPMKRRGPEYQAFLDELFDACFNQNESARRALLETARLGAVLTHSIGKRKEEDTVLTQREFISRLNRVRDRLVAQQRKR